MRKNKKYLLAVILGLLGVVLMWIIGLFEKPSQYDYFLSNKSDSEITIELIVSKKKQQSYTVESGVTICLSGYNFINQRESKISSMFKDIQVCRTIDTARFDYLDEDKWTYKEKGKVGRYILEITNSDFTY